MHLHRKKVSADRAARVEPLPVALLVVGEAILTANHESHGCPPGPSQSLSAPRALEAPRVPVVAQGAEVLRTAAKEARKPHQRPTTPRAAPRGHGHWAGGAGSCLRAVCGGRCH
jgi:hypothetical protein